MEPTTLIAIWPDVEPPTRMELVAALERDGVAVNESVEATPQADDVLWTAVLRSADGAAPIIAWAEAADPMTSEEFAGADSAPCKWVVGLQTVLETEDSLRSLIEFLRLADAGVGDAPAVLDVNARRWLLRSQLELLLDEEAPLPPGEMLWTIEAVERESSSHAEQSSGGVWLRTQGLLRCGLPELEMVEVPAAHAPVAAALLNDMAEYLLEASLPEPGEPIEIGVGLRVVLQPWSAIEPYLDGRSAGTAADRAARGIVAAAANDTADGDVAVVCAEQPAGQFRKLWVWPSDVARALAEDGAAVYKTTRATERTAALAQFTWPELAMTWSRVRKADEAANEHASGAVMLIKVGYEVVSDDSAAREHLWFLVREIAGDRAHGKLINQPMHVTTMSEGEETWLAREGVSDWRLVMPGGIVQPADMLMRSPGLKKLLAQLESAS